MSFSIVFGTVLGVVWFCIESITERRAFVKANKVIMMGGQVQEASPEINVINTTTKS